MNVPFGQQLKQLRIDSGLTQKELAKDLGLTFNQISDWETGRSQPDIDTLCRIADYFNITPNFLLGY